MEIYDHPTFKMASQQFDLVADHLQIPESDRARLKYPKRSMIVSPRSIGMMAGRKFLAAIASSTICRWARPREGFVIIRM